MRSLIFYSEIRFEWGREGILNIVIKKEKIGLPWWRLGCWKQRNNKMYNSGVFTRQNRRCYTYFISRPANSRIQDKIFR
jgi:hypothetical protein